MRNKLTDLNNHLFAQLERLNDEELGREELEQEIKRSKAISDIGKRIIENARVTLDAAQFAAEEGAFLKLPEMLMLEKKQEGESL